MWPTLKFYFFLGAGLLMSFHGHSCPSIMIICIQRTQKFGVSMGGAFAGMMRHVLFFIFFATAMVPSRDLVPYANSILCILVSLISHRPDRKGTLASDLKGAVARAPPAPPLCTPLQVTIGAQSPSNYLTAEEPYTGFNAQIHGVPPSTIAS